MRDPKLGLATLLTCLAATISPPAQADIFDVVTGTWGLLENPDLSCAANPHHISFTPDHSRAAFRWDEPMLSYEGDWRLEGGYTVLTSDETSLTMALDGESRLTEAGKPVVWILRVLAEGTRYCWSRTDWEPDRCIDRYIRCPGSTPVS